jgi:hypothetical protein
LTHPHPHTHGTHPHTHTHTHIAKMNTASAEKTPAKRVRIDTSNNKTYDYSSIAGSVATLLPVMKEVVNHYFNLFMKTSKSIYDKKNIIEKLNNSDFIPRSVKTKFQLGASELVKTSNDYNDLTIAVEQVKDAYEKKQKKHVLLSANLELKALHGKRNSIFVEGIHKLCCMMQLWKTKYLEVVEGEVHHIVKHILTIDNSLLMHVFNCNYTEFAQQYNKEYPLSVTIISTVNININNNNNDDSMLDVDIDDNVGPQTQVQRTMVQYLRRSPRSEPLTTQDSYTNTTASLTGTSIDDQTDTQTVDSDNDDYAVAPTTHTLHINDIVLLTRILKDIFVHSWTNEQKKIEDKLLAIKMTKFGKMTLTAKATNEAAAIVANEPSADMKLIEELIDKKVSEKTKKLQMELNATKQQLQRNQNNTINNSAKNVQRGEKSTRPNNKNQQNRRQRETTQTQSQRTTRSHSRSQTPTRSARKSTINNRNNNTQRPQQQNTPNRSTQKNQNTRNNNNRRTSTGQRNQTPLRPTSRKKAEDAPQGTSNENSYNRRKSNKRSSNSKTNNSSRKKTKRQRQQN